MTKNFSRQIFLPRLLRPIFAKKRRKKNFRCHFFAKKSAFRFFFLMVALRQPESHAFNRQRCLAQPFYLFCIIFILFIICLFVYLFIFVLCVLSCSTFLFILFYLLFFVILCAVLLNLFVYFILFIIFCNFVCCLAQPFCLFALAARRGEHRICLRNKKTRVRIPPGYKVFRET
jgi:hypothetical protein